MADLVTEGRKLVTIRKISEIKPIEKADSLELLLIDGWKVVGKKGAWKVGDYCVFFEIDSNLPVSDSRFEFLSKNAKSDNRARLRTIRLRGQISQGLVLSVDIFGKELALIGESLESLNISGHGIEKYLNVTKYENNPDSTWIPPNTVGRFPELIPKTDEDRIQNVFGKYSATMKGVEFRKSLKLDGSSETIAYFNKDKFFVNYPETYPFQWEDGQVMVCSRNLILHYEEENHFWRAALNQNIPERLRNYCLKNKRQLAVQGECMGPGIQKNREQLKTHQFFAFRVWDIDNQCFLDDSDFIDFCFDLGLTSVPQGDAVKFFDVYLTIDDALASAEHASLNHKIAEGDVYKSLTKVDGKTVHFKVINNQFLMKCEE